MPQGSTTTNLQIANSYNTSQFSLGGLVASLCANGTADGQQTSMLNMRYTQSVTQQTKLVGTGSINLNFVFQGGQMALSSNGNTLAIAGSFDNAGVGAVWIWTGSLGTWTQQAKLVGTGAVGQSRQGNVALSADGNTLVVGGAGDNSQGAFWFYTRSGSTWTQQGSKVTYSGVITNDAFGASIALSADGNTLAVGATRTSGSSPGYAVIYARSGNTWVQQGDIITSPNSILTGIRFGSSIALSADGNTLAVGAREERLEANGPRVGATYIFTRSGTTWSYETKLIGVGSVLGGEQGTSISLSANGRTLAVGAPFDAFKGSVYVFSKPSTSWVQDIRIPSTATAENQRLGSSVKLSADGNVLAFGEPLANSGFGRIYLYTRTNNTWTQQTNFNVSGNIGNPGIGSVVLSGNANTLAVGGSGDNSSVGATWVFT